MSLPEDSSDLVPNDFYDQTYSDINQLQTQLPEEAVFSLAREVLDRLAQQLSEPSKQEADVVSLCDALLSSDQQAAANLINERAQEGANFNALYLEHLAPAAKLLGEWWNTDRISFAKVTVGTGRIYAIMRSLNARRAQTQHLNTRSALFCCTPGDDHTLGVKMASDLARKSGWDIQTEIDASHDDLIDIILEGDHLLIGISGAGQHSLPNMAKLVLALRVSQPNARVLISGHVTRIAENSIKLMHVDGIGQDFDMAMDALDRLWQTLSIRPN